jgi:hypothetical protein
VVLPSEPIDRSHPHLDVGSGVDAISQLREWLLPLKR